MKEVHCMWVPWVNLACCLNPTTQTYRCIHVCFGLLPDAALANPSFLTSHLLDPGPIQHLPQHQHFGTHCSGLQGCSSSLHCHSTPPYCIHLPLGECHHTWVLFFSWGLWLLRLMKTCQKLSYGCLRDSCSYYSTVGKYQKWLGFNFCSPVISTTKCEYKKNTVFSASHLCPEVWHATFSWFTKLHRKMYPYKLCVYWIIPQWIAPPTRTNSWLCKFLQSRINFPPLFVILLS